MDEEQRMKESMEDFVYDALRAVHKLSKYRGFSEREALMLKFMRGQLRKYLLLEDEE